jgi:magnesium transporter
LTVLFLGEMFTATAVKGYQHDIEKFAVLATLMPLIISSGGNAGSQASTLVIRAMALGEARLSDWFRVLRREVIAGAMLGLILGAVGLIRIIVWQQVSTDKPYTDHYLLVAAAVGMSVFGVVLWGTITGAMLPILLRKCRLDPASASAPFVATLVDVTGLLIYFGVVTTLLRTTVLLS